MQSKILVFLQFLIIFLMSLSYGEATSNKFIGIFFLIVGAMVGVLAIKEHRVGNFNIRPDIKEHCELVTNGIYKYIRHPMYLSVLTMMLGILVLYFSFYEFILYLALVITLIIKLFYEESLWVNYSSKYKDYKKQTKRIIPFIF